MTTATMHVIFELAYYHSPEDLQFVIFFDKEDDITKQTEILRNYKYLPHTNELFDGTSQFIFDKDSSGIVFGKLLSIMNERANTKSEESETDSINTKLTQIVCIVFYDYDIKETGFSKFLPEAPKEGEPYVNSLGLTFIFIQSIKDKLPKTDPIINVAFRDDEDGDIYYNQNRIVDITVTERNFDANLIKAAIVNTFGDVPSFSFTAKSKTEYTTVIEFDEGDYTFNVTGTDLGNHVAAVDFSGGNEKLFVVDKTAPQIEENFSAFTDLPTENSFNYDKTIDIKITEHNLDPELINLSILRKAAGAVHNNEGFTDVTSEMVWSAAWHSEGDVHTLSLPIFGDAVYQVALAPIDLAGNEADSRSTDVFEIDKTVPIVIAKNGLIVDSEHTEYLDTYTYLREDEPAPTVEFEDVNIEYIKYSLTEYIPDANGSKSTTIKPVKVYLDEDSDKSGIIRGNKFTLSNFTQDGVYAVELVAIDTAGNESLLNLNTYARMIEQDVLAYIMESDIEKETGLYSLQYENGDAISKRPDNFKDIKISVLAPKDTDVDIVLRDNNGDELLTNAQATTDDSVYGMLVYDFILESEFFKDNFQDGTDKELFLTVKNEENRIDLGKIHIDSIAPSCDVPDDFKSWKWFYGEGNQTITMSNISELIDVNQCKVYDNGKEIMFTYSGDSNTLEFTLEKGWHNVGVTLIDMAGNAYNIQEITNVHIGFFWLWVIIAISAIVVFSIILGIVHNRRKRKVEEDY